MGLNGLEPSTSRLSGGRSNLLSYKPVSSLLSSVGFPLPVRFKSLSLGGDNRDRTDDPLLAKQVLSQLSYTPVFDWVLSSSLFFALYEPQKLNNEKT